jgi:Skp family chaperone for outer membrane proteins
VALVLAAGAALGLLFLFKDKLDDRGEMVPIAGFGGLYLRAREALTGGPVETTETSMLDARGPFVLVLALVPVLAAAGALYVYRKRREQGLSVYWPLTIAMVVMALPVLMGNSLAMPAMVAMAIAGFQVRRTEVPARMAEQAAAEAEADEDDDEYEDDEEEYEDDEYSDEYEDDDEDGEYEDDEEVDEAEDGDETDVDPLAELEEEIAAEDEADADNGRKR